MDSRLLAVRDFDLAYVRFGSAPDITRHPTNVRFTSESGQRELASICPLSAKTGLLHCNNYEGRPCGVGGQWEISVLGANLKDDFLLCFRIDRVSCRSH